MNFQAVTQDNKGRIVSKLNTMDCLESKPGGENGLQRLRMVWYKNGLKEMRTTGCESWDH